jgi:DNA (cytosine-5)-methyltransferase 1
MSPVCDRVHMGTTARAKSSGRPVAVELFSGAGGMTLGFEQAGFDVLASYDVDPIHVATHSFNFPRTISRCVDVSELTATTVRADVVKGWTLAGRAGTPPRRIDCLFGGPSCQGYSEIGRMDRDDPRNGLIFEFVRLVAALKPRYFVMENVPGLASPRYANTMAELCAQIESAGYTLVGGGAIRLNANDFGVPQVRKRVFLVGARKREVLPAKPTGCDVRVTSAQAISDLPDVDTIHQLLESDEVRSAQFSSRGRRSSYATSLGAGYGPDHLGYLRTWERSLLTNSRRTEHSAATRARLRALGQGKVDPVSRLRRLAADSPSTTLRAGTGRDHGSFTASRPVHYSDARVVTVREAARLHSFPDWFRLHSTKWHGFRQVGNAVPPKLARAVGASVVAAIGCDLARPSSVLTLGDTDLLSLTLTAAAVRLGYDVERLPRDVRRQPEAGDTQVA